MENDENFVENYYPSDIFTNSSNSIDNNFMNKNTKNPSNFSIENLMKMLSGNENLASILLSQGLNNGQNLSNLAQSNPLFNLLNRKSEQKESKKEEIIIDENSYEEY